MRVHMPSTSRSPSQHCPPYSSGRKFMSAHPLSSAGGRLHIVPLRTRPGQQPSRDRRACSGPTQLLRVGVLVHIPSTSRRPSQQLPYMSARVPSGAQVLRGPPGIPHLGALSATRPGQHLPPSIVGFCPGPAHRGLSSR